MYLSMHSPPTQHMAQEAIVKTIESLHRRLDALERRAAQQRLGSLGVGEEDQRINQRMIHALVAKANDLTDDIINDMQMEPSMDSDRLFRRQLENNKDKINAIATDLKEHFPGATPSRFTEDIQNQCKQIDMWGFTIITAQAIVKAIG